ncbi:MAG: hypothetical protein DVB23_000520, partial [Verrucomicrobia bacterium]
EARLLRWAWLRFLREAGDAGTAGHPSTEELVNEIAVSGEVRRAIEIARESAFTPGELETYDRFWDAVRRERTLISGSRKEGLQEGIQEGIRIGEERGIQIGEERGIQIGEERGIQIGEERGIRIGEQRALDLALSRLIASGISEAEARKLLGAESS